MNKSKMMMRTGKVAVGVALVGAAASACGGNSNSEPSQANSPTSAATGALKDGSYSATGKYSTPGGEQQVGVTVTLKDSVITKVELDTSQTQGTSLQFQNKFKSGIDQEVVGKNIDELNVHKVSGSSLTSGGFNSAIDQIKQEAAK